MQDFSGFSDAHRAALLAIVAADQPVEARCAWSSERRLAAAGVSAEVLAELAGLDLVVAWQPGRPVLWTLTPWGASILGVAIDERWERADDGTWNEVPYWCEAEELSVSVTLPSKRTRLGSFELAEMVPDRPPPPEVATHPETGQPLTLHGRALTVDQVARDPINGRALLLCNRPVTIDRRIRQTSGPKSRTRKGVSA